jgi:hypothetical protein
LVGCCFVIACRHATKYLIKYGCVGNQ